MHGGQRGLNPIGAASAMPEAWVLLCPTDRCSRYGWPDGPEAHACAISGRPLRRERLQRWAPSSVPWGRSWQSARPCSRKRRRHVRTVSGATPNRRDTSITECPSAHSNTIRDR